MKALGNDKMPTNCDNAYATATGPEALINLRGAANTLIRWKKWEERCLDLQESLLKARVFTDGDKTKQDGMLPTCDIGKVGGTAEPTFGETLHSVVNYVMSCAKEKCHDASAACDHSVLAVPGLIKKAVFQDGKEVKEV